MNLDKLPEIIDRYGADKTASLAILQDIQSEYRYLPRAALEEVAHRLDVPLSQVYRMATFFRAFSLNPKGEYVVKVCLGTACHVRGGPAILDTMERELGIKAGDTSEDSKFTLEAVRCVGACALGPVVLVNEQPHGNMSRDEATKLVKQLGSQGGSTEAPAETPLPLTTSVDLTGVPGPGK